MYQTPDTAYCTISSKSDENISIAENYVNAGKIASMVRENARKKKSYW